MPGTATTDGSTTCFPFQGDVSLIIFYFSFSNVCLKIGNPWLMTPIWSYNGPLPQMYIWPDLEVMAIIAPSSHPTRCPQVRPASHNNRSHTFLPTSPSPISHLPPVYLQSFPVLPLGKETRPPPTVHIPRASGSISEVERPQWITCFFQGQRWEDTSPFEEGISPSLQGTEW